MSGLNKEILKDNISFSVRDLSNRSAEPVDTRTIELELSQCIFRNPLVPFNHVSPNTI